MSANESGEAAADAITNGTNAAKIPQNDSAPFGPSSLPENCVEYMIFLIDQQLEPSNVLSGLEAVKKGGVQLMESLAKDYIWQRDGFSLEIKSHAGLLHLHGITDHGDSVEDEWLIVYVLRELTKSFDNIWVRVFDSDGEFLLVEAANVAPKWLNPEMDGNRVWIHQGKLLLIPLAAGDNGASKSISLPDAVAFIKSQAGSLVHSSFVESEAFYRLEKYPQQITDSIHCSLVTIPRKLAYVIHDRPKAIAPAVEAFYLRDPVALKPLLMHPPSRQLEFPPIDLVTVSVRFTKVLFAQLRSQRFEPPPPAWAELLPALPTESDTGAEPHSARARLEMGMKVTVGFELLAAGAEKSRSRVAREVAIVLEDLREDGADALPSDAEIRTWKDVDRDDDESWLDINYDDFERELDGKKRSGTSGDFGKGDAGFGDTNAQADLRKIVERFEAFLNDDDAGIDGAEVDDMDIDDDEDDDSDEDSEGEDKEVSFDEEEFARMMREMMGLPATDRTGKAPARPAAPPRGSAAADEDEQEIKAIQELAAQMEAELNEHGALKLDPRPKKLAALKGKAPARGASSSSKHPVENLDDDDDDEDDEDDDDDDGELNIDYNLAKNLLESFKSQAGMAGPAGNMLGMMGMGLPRDEDDGRDGK
ncbi:uncharacterized protein PpBr36_06713 [Pyricularia pennisetigena]|uniref:uncharacterized protein n=1 Tax=Pyricularia pennisetigena TaxID=1578925 RepID=UPI001153671D|nr:uncharacterized protein PpBr36_06713 [Pyricularia pennisetigena]TLS23296.1 hypothetical protein PpBr36_06713 [Pyricularia pennisetigena]